MKILLVSNMYPSDENPQYGVFVKNSEEILKNNNIEVDKVVATKKTGKFAKVVSYFVLYIKSMIKSLNSEYDYVYIHYVSHSSLGVLIAKLIKPSINIIANAHGSDIIPENRKQEKFGGIRNKILMISKKIIVPSNYYRELISNEFNIEKEKIYIFPSGGIDNDIFKPIINKDNIKKDMNLDNNYKYIGFVGRLDYGKGWDVLLESINLIKNEETIKEYKFIFVGNGKEEEKFKNKIEEYKLKDKIITINFLEHSKLTYLYNSLDVFCFPTLRRGESLGLVGLEALACGIPIIASNFAGPKDYVEDEKNGYLFEKGNAQDLSRKIIKFISMEENEKQEMSLNAFNSSKDFWRNNVEELLINIFLN